MSSSFVRPSPTALSPFASPSNCGNDGLPDQPSNNASVSSFDELTAEDDGPGGRGLQSMLEVDAESMIVPVISNTQSTARYAAATASSNHPPEPVSPSSSDDEEAASEKNATKGPIPRDGEQRHRAVPHVLPKAVHNIVPLQKRAQTAPQHVMIRPHNAAHALPHRKSLPDSSRKESQRKSGLFSLPSFQMPTLPNVSLPSFGSSSAGISAAEKDKMAKRKRAKTMMLPRPTTSTVFSSGIFGTKSKEDVDIVPDVERTFVPLRRASSANSLVRMELSKTQTGRSSISSLGDDAKFSNVRQQTNSRYKAIKDNLLAGLPAMPYLPHLQQHLANLNPFSEPSEHPPPPMVPRSAALEALDTVTGDVVVLGGYRGSVLRDAVDGRRVWVPLKVGFNLRKIDLEVGVEPGDEEREVTKIRPDGMLKSISGVDISRRLVRRLRNKEEEHGRRVHDWGYDWRLSPALSAKRLIKYLETLPCNAKFLRESRNIKRKGKGALVICHSLGGLVVRSAINQRPELFSGVLFAGTPSRCVNILGAMRNGDSVLFNSKVFTAQVNFTLRSSFAFLPEDGACFIDKNTGEPIPVNFYSVECWQELGFSPVISDLPFHQHSPSFRFPNASVLQNLKPILPLSEKTNQVAQFSPPASNNVADMTLGPTSIASSSSADQSPITIPRAKALEYLERTLASTLEFRKSMYYRPELEGMYPPMAVLYAKTTPTVRGALVDGYNGIKRSDAYDELLFGAGDGVCLARSAMLPEGYKCCKTVAVDRGHVSLLGDLEGAGKCVQALVKWRGW